MRNLYGYDYSTDEMPRQKMSPWGQRAIRPMVHYGDPGLQQTSLPITTRPTVPMAGLKPIADPLAPLGVPLVRRKGLGGMLEKALGRRRGMM